MTGFLIYDAKVAVLIVVFYMFYRLLLSKETFHRVNRVVLLSTALLSFILPLCVITTHQTVVLDAVPMVSVGNVQMEMATDEQPAQWQYVIPLLYIIGVVVVLSHTLLSVWRVLMLVRRSERIPQADGTTLCVVPDEVPPFSFCSFIVMNRNDYNTGDSAILQGINARQYQYLLITKAASIGGYSIANGISHSTLKNRITMMLQKKSPRSSFMKLLALIPIVGVALALNAETVKDYVYQQPQKKIIKKGKKNATAKMGNNTIEIVPDTASNARIDNPEVGVQKEVKDVFVPVEQNPKFFDVVEQMPEFPGGAHALFEFLGKNIHYPKAAEDAGIQGRVIVTFVVMKDGSIGEVKVAKGVSPELDAEALRCVKSMPKWMPGKQNGEALADGLYRPWRGP